jgi:hypothetical protein
VGRIGFGWSNRQRRTSAGGSRAGCCGALIEDPALLRDESFDLDLIGFAATDLASLLARAGGGAASDDAED